MCMLASKVYRPSGTSTLVHVRYAVAHASPPDPATSAATPVEPCFFGSRASVARRRCQAWCPQITFLHAHPDFADASKEATKGAFHFSVQFLFHQTNSKRVECFHVLIKTVAREVGKSFQGINDHGPPGNDVALLSLFIE